ncbi:MAG TPA: RidA family protein [Vicinamibacterales bacterium]|nr:RidA family protein [Vicinamibacterales bacterium]
MNNHGIECMEFSGDVPSAIGHYSHAVELDNGIVFLSGQKAWKAGTGDRIEGEIAAQTRQVLLNIETILSELRLNWSHVTRMQCCLADPVDYAAFNEVYASVLGIHRPARTTLAGFRLRGGALIEIISEAYRGRQ